MITEQNLKDGYLELNTELPAQIDKLKHLCENKDWELAYEQLQVLNLSITGALIVSDFLETVIEN